MRPVLLAVFVWLYQAICDHAVNTQALVNIHLFSAAMLAATKIEDTM